METKEKCMMGMKSKQAKRKKQKKASATEPRSITRAVTHIGLFDTNAVKLTALDALAPVYMTLCQQYVTLFSTMETPDKLRAPLYETALSERWHRVAIMQAAGIAQSWRSNLARARLEYKREQEEYEEKLRAYFEQKERGTLEPREKALKKPKTPVWQEWNVPALEQWCIQANANVAKLEASGDSSFDYWLKISTLDKRKTLLVPVKLADYHKQVLKEKKINSSVTLNKRDGIW
jgi:hypothetical protein